MTRIPMLTSPPAAVRWTVDLASLAPANPAMRAPMTAERLAAVVTVLAERLSVAASTVPAGAGASPPTDTFITAVRRAIRTVAGRPDLPVLPIVPRSRLPVLRPNADLDAIWLEIVAAVRPRLASLEASQLDATRPDWVAAVAAPDEFGRSLASVRSGAGRVWPRHQRRWKHGRDCRVGWVDRFRAKPTTRHGSGVRVQRTEIARASSRAGGRAARPLAAARQRGPARRRARNARTRAGASAATDRRAHASRIRPRPHSSAQCRHATFSTGGQNERSPLPDPRTRTHRYRRGSARSRGRSCVVHHPAVAARRTPGRGRLDTGRGHCAPQHVPITYDRSRPDLDPTVIPAEALLEAEPGDWWTIGRRVPAGPRGHAAPRRDRRARFRLGTLPAPYQNLAGEVDGRAVFLAGLLAGNAIWAEVPSPAADRWSSSELDYSASFEAGGTALRARNHTGGDVDWFTVDGDPVALPITRPPSSPPKREVIPGRLDYPGAPNPRWWQLEDQRRGHRRVHARSLPLRHDAAAGCGARACRRLVHVPRAAAFRSGR